MEHFWRKSRRETRKSIMTYFPYIRIHHSDGWVEGDTFAGTLPAEEDDAGPCSEAIAFSNCRARHASLSSSPRRMMSLTRRESGGSHFQCPAKEVTANSRAHTQEDDEEGVSPNLKSWWAPFASFTPTQLTLVRPANSLERCRLLRVGC